MAMAGYLLVGLLLIIAMSCLLLGEYFSDNQQQKIKCDVNRERSYFKHPD